MRSKWDFPAQCGFVWKERSYHSDLMEQKMLEIEKKSAKPPWIYVRKKMILYQKLDFRFCRMAQIRFNWNFKRVKKFEMLKQCEKYKFYAR